MEPKGQTLLYTQTDDKTHLCCRMSTLADINSDTNIEAQSSFTIPFKQNAVERVGLWCEVLSGILQNKEGRILSDISRLSTWQDTFLSHTTWVPSILWASCSSTHVFTGVTSTARVSWAQQTPGPRQATLILWKFRIGILWLVFVTYKPGSYHQAYFAGRID